MASAVEILAPVSKRINAAEAELRQFRAELDSAASSLPSTMYEQLTGMSDEVTNILKRVFRLQENVRKASVAAGAKP